MDISDWFKRIGLPVYAQAFADEGIDPRKLASFDDTALARLGVLPAHRQRILRAAALLAKEESHARAAGTSGNYGAPASTAGDAERRQLTLLCCDLVDSTGLSEQLDPEDLRDVLRSYQETLTRSVSDLEGHVANVIGDGVMACFGYPVAHEDDAARAVLTGLDILQKIAQNNSALQRQYRIEINVRIGVHTGVVVVGDIGGEVVAHTRQIVGTAPNIAARLQAIAPRNGLVVSDSTLELVRGQFDCLKLGDFELKGIAETVPVYHVQAAAQLSSRFEVKERIGFGPFIGRNRELRLLSEIWKKAGAGIGNTVVLAGEPGIGKSRLIRAFRDTIASTTHFRFLYFCSPYHANTALYPIIEHLTRELDFQRADDNAVKLAKLEQSLRQFDLKLDDFVPYLAQLLSLDLQPPYTLPALTPKRLRKQILDRLIRVVEAASRERPVLVVIEDLHWADASTLELINDLIQRSGGVRLMLIGSVRSPPGSPWTNDDSLALLHLQRLSDQDCATLAATVSTGSALPAGVVREIVARSDGNPLFIEELTKGYISQKAAPSTKAPVDAVPTTLRASLTGRLDRLGIGRNIAQFCSTIGRRFQEGFVVEVSPFSRDQLDSGIEQLMTAEVLLRHQDGGSTVYEFKHALLQDAAYATLLRSRRREYHQRIAETLESGYPDIAALEPELLAHHFEEAGAAVQAITYWEKAGKRAIDRSANVEAVALLDRGLDLLGKQEESVGRDEKELILLIWLGTALTATNSYADEQVRRTYSRARALCERLGGAPQLFPVLSGLYRFYFVRSELITATDITEQMLEVAVHVQRPGLLLEAHRSIGFCLAFQGHLREALEHVDQSLTLFDVERDGDHRFVYGTDAKVASLSVRATILWLQGYPVRASDEINVALGRAREIVHPFTEAWASNFAAVIFQLIGDIATSKVYAERTIEIASRHDFPFWHAGGTIMQGAAIFAEAHRQQGVELMRRGLDAWRATGAEIFRPYFVLLLAEACGAMGDHDEAISLVDDSLTEQSEHNEVWMAAETYRVRAELLHASRRGNADAVELSLRVAKEIAAFQGAHALQLRAQMSVVRYCREAGKPLASEHDELSKVVGLFDEGGQFQDLQQARQLLADTR